MTKKILCITGLGNPGPKYESTRHNAGFWLIDEIARQHNLQLRQESKFHGQLVRLVLPSGHSCWLLKPTTFMNRSGLSVGALMKFYRLDPEQLLVAHDELDLPPGSVKLKKGGGHGGHNGLRDIINVLGSRDFHRLRIGIGHPGHKDAVVNYVLSSPRKAEQENIIDAISRSVSQLENLLDGQFDRVMNQLHNQ